MPAHLQAHLGRGSVHERRRSTASRPGLRVACIVSSLFADEILPYRRPVELPRVNASQSEHSLLVLPGFGNASEDYTNLCRSLRSRGFDVSVLPVERRCWFNVARALLSPRFWDSSCTFAEGYGWYVQRVLEHLQELPAEQTVTLVGHSAGGWLARAVLSDEAARAQVSGLVSLGTPHLPPPPGGNDVTRGALTWLNLSYPGAFFESVRYVSVAGKTVLGRPVPKGEPRTPASYAAASYSQLLGGTGEGQFGDAVVPVACALLPGSRTLLLPGVWHSMSKLGSFDEPSDNPWYGSEVVVDTWLSALLAPF